MKPEGDNPRHAPRSIPAPDPGRLTSLVPGSLFISVVNQGVLFLIHLHI